MMPSSFPFLPGRPADLFLFMGQSNMAGRGVPCARYPQSAPACLPGAGWEFRAVSDPSRLYPAAEPFGKEENRPGGIFEPGMKTGSLVTSFINAYYRETGTPVIGVSASKGGSAIGEWQPGGAYLTDALQRLETAERYFSSHAVSIRHRFVLWCQGETDGDLGTSPEAYEAGFLSLQNALLTHGMEHLFLIRIGCFNDMSQKAGSPDDRSREDAVLRSASLKDAVLENSPLKNTAPKDAASAASVPGAAEDGDRKLTVPDYAPIRAAQEHLALTRPDVTMVSRLFSGMRERGMMKDAFHYYQYAYNLVGEDAGRHAAEYVRNLPADR